MCRQCVGSGGYIGEEARLGTSLHSSKGEKNTGQFIFLSRLPKLLSPLNMPPNLCIYIFMI